MKSRKKILLKLFFMLADTCRLCLQDLGCILTCAAVFLALVRAPVVAVQISDWLIGWYIFSTRVVGLGKQNLFLAG